MKTGPDDEGTKRDVTFTILRQKKGPRAVASGGAWGLNSPPSPVFGQTVKPTSSRGGRLCLPQYYEPPPPGFYDGAGSFYAILQKKRMKSDVCMTVCASCFSHNQGHPAQTRSTYVHVM
jgi:hypothetical protein